MSSMIAEMLSRIFPKAEYRVLMLGLDASGKTSILYKLKLGEIVTTIPTIGFNVETVDVHGVGFTMWDVGGCDKIRPLWRHYYQNTQAIIYVVDSNDRERLTPTPGGEQEWYYTSKGLLDSTLNEDELRGAKLLMFLNKQDLPNAMSQQEIEEKLKIEAIRARGVEIFVQPCCATSGDGLYEGLLWLKNALKNPQISSKNPVIKPVEPTTPVKTPQEELLEEWLEREDDEDDVFLQQLRDCTLSSWDHYTHLRIAWLLLHRLGRRDAMPVIFSQLKHFIAHSPRTRSASAGTRGTTFHETMTYFWTHMVHYAMVATPLPETHRSDFKTFLLMNPQLSNGGLFLEFYSKQRMLMDPLSRESVQLPDIKPLPSLIPAENASKHVFSANAETLARLEIVLPNMDAMSDGTFFQLALLRQLPSWGHAVKLRLLYLALIVYGRQKGGVDRVLTLIQSVEKQGFHLSLTYFWLQMLTLHMLGVQRRESLTKESFGLLSGEVAESSKDSVASVLAKSLPFNEFLGKRGADELQDELLFKQYYSDKSLSDESCVELKFPDLKSFPAMIK